MALGGCTTGGESGRKGSDRSPTVSSPVDAGESGAPGEDSTQGCEVARMLLYFGAYPVRFTGEGRILDKKQATLVTRETVRSVHDFERNNAEVFDPPAKINIEAIAEGTEIQQNEAAGDEGHPMVTMSKQAAAAIVGAAKTEYGSLPPNAHVYSGTSWRHPTESVGILGNPAATPDVGWMNLSALLIIYENCEAQH